jgi:hypothetical protein
LNRALADDEAKPPAMLERPPVRAHERSQAGRIEEFEV